MKQYVIIAIHKDKHKSIYSTQSYKVAATVFYDLSNVETITRIKLVTTYDNHKTYDVLHNIILRDKRDGKWVST